jgi:hypothetical protein
LKFATKFDGVNEISSPNPLVFSTFNGSHAVLQLKSPYELKSRESWFASLTAIERKTIS